MLQRNAGGRQFKTASELNAFITQLNASGGVNGVPLPLVSNTARFNDAFSSLDLRVSRTFALGNRVRIEPMVEVFNLFNTTNILGVSIVNYSGFSNVLVRDSDTPGTPGFLSSSRSASRSRRREACSAPAARGRCSSPRGSRSRLRGPGSRQASRRAGPADIRERRYRLGMMRTVLLAAAVVAVIGGYLYWTNDERQIRRLLDGVTDAVSQGEGEGGVAGLAEVAGLTGYLAPDVVLEPGAPFRTIVGAPDIVSTVGRLRAVMAEVGLELPDAAIAIDGATASVHVTARLSLRDRDGETRLDVREAEVSLRSATRAGW